jgi:hypothetical protein
MKSVLFKRITTVFAVATSLGLLLGCSDDDEDSGGSCDAAVEKIKGCGYPMDEQVTCETEADKCAAACVEKHSCEEIDEAYTVGTGAFAECMSACQ